MIEALVSGQAAAYAILGKSTVVHHLGGHTTSLPRGAVGFAFQGCTDVRQIKAKSEKEVAALCKLERDVDRALRLLLMIFEDPFEEVETLRELLDALVDHPFVMEGLEKAMYVATLPIRCDVSALAEVFRPSRVLSRFFEQLSADQPLIARVREALDAVPKSTFKTVAKYEVFQAAVFSAGFQRDLVLSLRSGKPVDLAILKFTGELRHIEGARDAIQLWTAEMRSNRKPLPSNALEEEDELDHPERSFGEAGRKILERVLIQQNAIRERLKSRDLEGARRFARQLIEQQASNSSKEQIGKSLSRLSILAKQQGVPELQLEWAEQAVEQNPYDAITFAHLIDALICSNRLHDAEKLVHELEEKSDTLFLRTARARLLRVTGRYPEAREKYLQAVSSFPNDPEVRHAKAGAVETLRDLGLYDLALKEYEVLVAEDPLNQVFQCGLASVCMDLGLFDRAIAGFNKAGDRRNTIALNGRATAYKLAGKFDAAIRLYDQVIAEFPNDVVSLCGKAEVYRAQGDLLQALSAFETAVDRSPFTSGPVAGKVNVLRDLGRLDELEEFLEAATKKFPYDHAIASGYADVLRVTGQLPNALAAYDAVLQKFPFAISARMARANVLRRLDRPEEALRDYNRLLAERPYLASAKHAKASLLLEKGDYHAVEGLISERQPRSYEEWTGFFLRAMLYQSKGQTFKSMKLLEEGMKRTPFARQRRLFAAAFSRQRIRSGEPSLAVKSIDASPNEVSNIIRLHALAASGRDILAKEAWSAMSHAKPHISSEIIDLAGEIARRYRVIEGGPERTVEWIYQMETKLMLEEATSGSFEMKRAAA
ncbi:tetratricopeptide repeat protein [Bradyrhizobium amphicarpaeae]|uniref:Tetratricopeptide repeat protein n=1 Tax=Bradyrhizobium amphicarpaeae TaxID=1404768 RepID=A0A2U8Q0Q9_9BRAD|nr:tetratricopeptide repeat protein [Bradyrhizobium amphicarpaeae]AWM03673.1 hypothetical protein CIT40_28965 [Bradyrhizobium amphicarpaeae]